MKNSYFRLSSILTIINGTGITTEEIENNPGTFIAVQSGEENNGVLGKIDLVYCKKMNYKYTEKPCLTVARSGSAGFVSYQPNGCVVGDSAKILLLPDDVADEYIYLYIQTILRMNRYKYTYGRKVTKDNYANLNLYLPIVNINEDPIIDSSCKWSDKGYIPDWEYMKNYILSARYKPITTSNSLISELSIDVDSWAYFRIGDIFNKLDLAKFSKIPDVEGETPFVSSTSYNNGVNAYVDEDAEISNCITVSTNGECLDCFYHDYPIAISTDVEVLKNDKLNKYSAIFICTVLMVEKPKWSFGRKPKNDKVFDITIKLPYVTHSGVNEPDWEFMERFIKLLPYGDKI